MSNIVDLTFAWSGDPLLQTCWPAVPRVGEIVSLRGKRVLNSCRGDYVVTRVSWCDAPAHGSGGSAWVDLEPVPKSVPEPDDPNDVEMVEAWLLVSSQMAGRLRSDPDFRAAIERRIATDFRKEVMGAHAKEMVQGTGGDEVPGGMMGDQ